MKRVIYFFLLLTLVANVSRGDSQKTFATKNIVVPEIILKAVVYLSSLNESEEVVIRSDHEIDSSHLTKEDILELIRKSLQMLQNKKNYFSEKRFISFNNLLQGYYNQLSEEGCNT